MQVKIVLSEVYIIVMLQIYRFNLLIKRGIKDWGLLSRKNSSELKKA